MTDFELLFIDLSSRLPYDVKVYNQLLDRSGTLTKIWDNECIIDGNDGGYVSDLRPYLRPMSSMTEEERKEYKHFVAFSGSPEGAANFVDWLNKKMFAYRTIDDKDMFELGLALEAPDGMYETK